MRNVVGRFWKNRSAPVARQDWSAGEAENGTLGRSNVDLVAEVYRELLARDPDEDGLRAHAHALSTGATLDHVRNSIIASDEYKDKMRRDAGVDDHWGEAARRREQNPLMGWLDGSLLLRLHVQSTVTGDLDKNWLVGVAGNEAIPKNSNWLSLGCGAGGQEIYASEMGLFQRMVAYDISPGSIEIAAKNAALKGVSNIEFRTANVEAIELDLACCDVVLFNMSLHHVRGLERVLAECRQALRPGGCLIFNEYVGPNQMQFEPARLALITDILATLPDRLKFDYVQSTTKTFFRMKTAAEWNIADPSESTRSSEIIAVCEDIFGPGKIIPYGGTLLNPLLEHIIGNFDADREDDVSILKLLVLFEKTLIRNSVLGNDFAVGVFRRT